MITPCTVLPARHGVVTAVCKEFCNAASCKAGVKLYTEPLMPCCVCMACHGPTSEEKTQNGAGLPQSFWQMEKGPAHRGAPVNLPPSSASRADSPSPKHLAQHMHHAGHALTHDSVDPLAEPMDSIIFAKVLGPAHSRAPRGVALQPDPQELT